MFMRNKIPFCSLLGAMAALWSVAPRVDAQAQSQTGGGKQAASAFYSQANLWDRGVVPYEFDFKLPIGQRSAFIEAAREWERVANVKFIPRTSEGDYVRVTNLEADGSFSAIGKQGGAQVLALATNSKFAAVHEIGHTLGLMNEQQRSDRDTFVTIDGANIVAGQESNFDIVKDSANSTGYDFLSIMHDEQFAFAKDKTKPTITAKPDFKDNQEVMGQRFQISGADGQGVRSRYGFSRFPGTPRNDRFASAEQIEGPVGGLRASTAGARRETGEDDHARGGGDASIWYRWRPVNSGRVTFTTQGSDINTSLAVYLGLSVSTVTEVASSNDINNTSMPPNLTSSVTFLAQADATYYIAVDGTLNTSNIQYKFRSGGQIVSFSERSSGDSGPISLNWNQIVDTPRFRLSGLVQTGTTPPQGVGGVIISLGGADESNSATAATVTTDSSGNYSFTNLLAGNYNLSASKDGFSFAPNPLKVNMTGDSTGNNFTATAIPVAPLPEMYVSDVAVREGKTSDVFVTFNVSISVPAKETIVVSYATADGTATAGSDYNATTGSLVFSPGVVTMAVSIKLRPETVVEPDENFLLKIFGADGAKIVKETGVATIVNDD